MNDKIVFGKNDPFSRTYFPKEHVGLPESFFFFGNEAFFDEFNFQLSDSVEGRFAYNSQFIRIGDVLQLPELGSQFFQPKNPVFREFIGMTGKKEFDFDDDFFDERMVFQYLTGKYGSWIMDCRIGVRSF